MTITQLISRTLLAHQLQFKGLCGKGGFSNIYLVYSEKYGMDFCAKVVKPDVTIRDKINIIRGLEHPNIIRIFNFFEDEKYQYLIMEHCTGGSLADLLNKSGPLSDEKALEYASATASALLFCHERNIAHLDIKPSNLLLDSNGRLKVCDFGLSKIVAKGQKLDTIGGSLPFLPPEVVQGKDYDPFLADVWSLGVTLYVLISGKTPWIGFSKLDIKNSITDAVVPTKPIEHSILYTTILKMIQKVPEKRITICAVIPTLKELLKCTEMERPQGTNKRNFLLHLTRKNSFNRGFLVMGVKRRALFGGSSNTSLPHFSSRCKMPTLTNECTQSYLRCQLRNVIMRLSCINYLYLTFLNKLSITF